MSDVDYDAAWVDFGPPPPSPYYLIYPYEEYAIVNEVDNSADLPVTPFRACPAHYNIGKDLYIGWDYSPAGRTVTSHSLRLQSDKLSTSGLIQ